MNQQLALHTWKRGATNAAVVFDGTQVLSILKNRNFDIVLMDLQMPEMDGFQDNSGHSKIEKTTGQHFR